MHMTRATSSMKQGLAVALLPSWVFSARANLVINEIAFKGTGDGTCNAEDWIELLNTGEQPVDLTNYVLHDDNGEDDMDAKIFGDVTMVPGEFLLLCKDVDFMFGIAGDDVISLRSATGAMVTSAALPDEGADDGTETYAFINGEYRYTTTPTPGEANVYTEPVPLEDVLAALNHEKTGLLVESENCGPELASCAYAGHCFSHLLGCAEDGSMIYLECDSALPCTPCFPNSRCGGEAAVVDIDDSGSFVETDDCGPELAECADASPCFAHGVGCAEDGSMTYEICKASLPFCKPCFPNSRCGSGEASNMEATEEEDTGEDNELSKEEDTGEDNENFASQVKSSAYHRGTATTAVLSLMAAGMLWCLMTA